MENPFSGISNKVSEFAGDVADAWSGKKAGVGEKLYYAIPETLGQGSVGTEHADIDYNSDTSQDLADARALAAGETTSKDPFMLFEFMNSEIQDDKYTAVTQKISDLNALPPADTDMKNEVRKGQIINAEKDREKLLENIGKRFVVDTVAMYWTPGFQISDSMNYSAESRKLMAGAGELKGVFKDADVTKLLSGDSDEWTSIKEKFAGKYDRSDVDTIYNAYRTEIMGGIFGMAGKMGGGTLIGALGLGGGGAAGNFLGDEALRKSGKVMNPNEYLNYQSTALRSFSFNWKILPNSDAESTDAQAIIEIFRSSAHAKRRNAFVLNVPDHVVVSFHGVEGIPGIPPVVITNVNVTYNPNAASFFSINNHPVEIDLAVTVQELAPIYKDDIELKGY